MVRLFRWQIKTAYKDASQNKLRFFLAIFVIGLSVSMLIGVNGAVDNLTNNYAEILFSEMSDTDVVIQTSQSPIISNSSKYFTEFGSTSLVEMSSRYYLDAKILIANPVGADIAFPTKVVGINITRELEINLGSFSPNIDHLEINKSIMFGNFGQQIISRLGTNLSVELDFFDGFSANISLITNLIDQENKFSRQNWNIIVVSLETLYQFIEPDSATQLVGVFQDHETIYSINNVQGSINAIKNRGIDIQEKLGFDYSVTLPLASIFESAEESLEGQRLTVNFIIIIVVLIAGVMIYGLINISIESKSYNFGVYRALGLKNNQVILQAFYQALIKGIFGILFGIILGFLISIIFFPDAGGIFPVSNDTLIYAVFIGFALTIFSSLSPVLQASKKSILLALDISKTESSEFESRLSSKRTNLISKSKIYSGIGLAFVGVLLFVILPFVRYNFGEQTVNTIAFSLIIFVLIGVILIFLGLFAPIFQIFLVKVLSKISVRSSLGTKIFLKKNFRRNNITMVVFALTLSFVLFMSTNQAVNIQSQIYFLQANIGTDLTVLPIDPEDTDLKKDLLNYTQSNSDIFSSYITSGSFIIQTGNFVKVGDPLFFKSYSPAVYATTDELFKSLFGGVAFIQGTNISLINQNNTVIISDGLSKSLDVGLGDSLRLELSSPTVKNDIEYGKTIQLKIIGILQRLPGFPSINTDESRAFQSPLFIGSNTWYNIIAPNNVTETNQTSILENDIRRFFINVPPFQLDSIKTSLFLEYGTKILIIDYQEILENLETAMKSSINALSTILSLSVVISLFAVLTSTTSAVTESKHDIGVLKALGIKNSVIIRLFVFETVIITIVSTILGGFAGYITAIMLAYQGSVNGNYPLPIVGLPDTIIYTYLFAIVLAIIGAYLPSRSINKINPIDILKSN